MVVATVIVILTALVIGGIIYDRKSEFGSLVAMVAGVLLLTFVGAWSVTYFEYKGEVPQYYAVKQTIEMSREKLSDNERATITANIIEINKSIASARYWNETIVGDFIPDDFAKLNYLK